MLSLVLVILAQPSAPTVVKQGRALDGGIAWAVTCDNCSGGGGGGSSSGQATLDGGYTNIYNFLDSSSGALTAPADSTNRALRVNIVAGAGSGGTASTYGAAFPGQGTAAGFTDGANMQPAKVDANKSLYVIQGPGWSNAVTGTFWQATQPVSGTVTTSPPANASTNVAQFGGSAVATGTGVGGAGIPRVTVSSDSSLSATVSGTVTANAGTGTMTVGQATGTNLHVVVDSAPSTAVTGPLTDAQLRASAVPVSLTSTTLTGTSSTSDTPRTVSSANNTGTCTSVSTSTTVLASNASRKAYGVKASEANTDRVYCKLGATATTSNMPFGAGAAWSQDTGAVYTGVIDCIAGSGTQTVCVFEFN